MHINPQHMEIEQIYSHLHCNGRRSICLCAANVGEGVTTIAVALAQRNLVAGKSTLLVDLNCHRPALTSLLHLPSSIERSFEGDITGLLEEPQLVSCTEQEIGLTGIPCPRRRELIIKLRQPGVLERCIAQWLETYDTILFDTSAINRTNANNIPPERVAAACDGALLVVLAGSTTETMVSSAMEKLQSGGAQLLACVYNDRDNPTLKNELIRELNRLEPRFKSLARHFGIWINKNNLLSMSV